MGRLTIGRATLSMASPGGRARGRLKRARDGRLHLGLRQSREQVKEDRNGRLLVDLNGAK